MAMHNIFQEIEKEIVEYMSPFKEDYIEQCFEVEMNSGWHCDDVYQIEVTGFHKNEYTPEKQTPFVLLRLFINYQYNQIQISNIFLPNFMRGRGIGKSLIHRIFLVSEKKSFKLFIVDMVDSFYRRMINMGALPCDDCDDAVQIVDETKLIDN